MMSGDKVDKSSPEYLFGQILARIDGSDTDYTRGRCY